MKRLVGVTKWLRWPSLRSLATGLIDGKSSDDLIVPRLLSDPMVHE